MNHETRIGVALVSALGALVFGMLVLGSLGGVNPDLRTIPVGEVLARYEPHTLYGSTELRIVGWYAEMAGDCVGDDGGADPAVAWLQRECPLRVLLPGQGGPLDLFTLELGGLRLAAPTGRPFPPRAQPGGFNLQHEQLVFVGHFDDPAAANCVPERVLRCRDTFVVTNYTGLLR